MNEVSIFKKSDPELYQSAGEIIESMGGAIVGPGYEQLDYPVDQAYIDFQWKGKTLTLHLEHYLGISIYSKQLALQELQKIAQTITAKVA